MKRLLIPTTIVLGGMLAASLTAQAQETHFTRDDFLTPVSSADLVDNQNFVPSENAEVAKAPFEGTLHLSETAMLTTPEKFQSNDVLGKDPQIFPELSLSFITVGDDLVPSTQDVIRVGSTEKGKSFWDVIVQPGKVWSEKGDDWSRASFPFSLVNMIEGETHNGVAMFFYKDGEVSDVRYQILTETAPYYVVDYFTAAGTVPAQLSATSVGNADQIASTFEAAKKDAIAFHDWSELADKVGEDKLDGFDSAIRPDELVLDGLAIDGNFYLKSCPTPAGELPYCDRQRFGVWSVTKSTVAATGMLAVAQKYGDEIFDMKIPDLIPEAKGIKGWDKVSVGDALNMATGMGYGQRTAEPKTMWSPYNDDYYAFYEARSEHEKLDLLLNAAKPYDWGPGVMPRYRDEDMFLVGAALTNYLKTKEGDDANLWDFLKREVYEPIGIHYAPTNKTIEQDGSEGQPLSAYGYYPTAGDLLKIAELYQNGGKFDGKQILSADEIADITVTSDPVGLETGLERKPYYAKAFWRYPFESDTCSLYFPSMDGWGENHVMLMPNDMTAIRLAKNWDGDESSEDVTSIIRVANQIKSFCQ